MTPESVKALLEFLDARYDEATDRAQGSGRVAWLTYRDASGAMEFTAVAAATVEAPDVWIVAGREATGYADIQVIYDEREVLDDIAAKRAILELHDGEHDCRELITGVYPHDWPSAAPWGSAGEAWRHASGEHFEGPCPTVRLLAQPFAGRPGWREEWRP